MNTERASVLAAAKIESRARVGYFFRFALPFPTTLFAVSTTSSINVFIGPALGIFALFFNVFFVVFFAAFFFAI
jgi:hypothetical protein